MILAALLPRRVFMPSPADWLLRESGELRAIFGKSLGTALANQST